jgi:hypothetical protein
MPSCPAPSSPSVQPVSRLDCLSWDCPKIAPPSSCHHRSPLPEVPRGDSLRNEPAKARPCSVLVVFHHLDGLLLRQRARVLQRAPDPGVHPVSAPTPQVTSRCRHLLGMPSLPSEAFPPFEAAPSAAPPPHANVRWTAASSARNVTDVLPRRSPLPLPPRPFLPLTLLVAAVARACVQSPVP